MAREEVLVAGNRRVVQVQMRTERRNVFGPQRREFFLNVLAATCNVQLAARRADISVTTAYRIRRQEPAFAELWREAILIGYERLEAALLARAMGTDAQPPADFEFGDPEAVLPEGEIDADLGCKLLTRYRAMADGRARPVRAGRHIATEEETNAALMKKLAVLRKQIEHEAQPPEPDA